jgi:hypothetical protein
MFRRNILWVEKNVSVVQRSVGTSCAVKINYINPFSNQCRIVIQVHIQFVFAINRRKLPFEFDWNEQYIFKDLEQAQNVPTEREQILSLLFYYPRNVPMGHGLTLYYN